MKYIDAEKLIAEIERLKEETPIGICEYDKGEENGRYEVLNHLLSTITSLQQEQPEVDEDFFFDEILNVFDSHGRIPPKSEEAMNVLETIASHFWNKGYNARKEEDK